MTKSHEFFKEDVEREELDDLIYRQERDHIIEQEYREWLKSHKFIIGKAKNRHKNRNFKHGKFTTGKALPF